MLLPITLIGVLTSEGPFFGLNGVFLLMNGDFWKLGKETGFFGPEQVIPEVGRVAGLAWNECADPLLQIQHWQSQARSR